MNQPSENVNLHRMVYTAFFSEAYHTPAQVQGSHVIRAPSRRAALIRVRLLPEQALLRII